MNRDELYAEAKRLDIAGRSKMTKDELEDAINRSSAPKDSEATSAQTLDLVDTSAVSPAGELPEWERQLIESAQERIDSAVNEVLHEGPKLMGLHFRGRAMGAKHHALIRNAMGEMHTPPMVDPFMSRDDFRHTPNSERVQKYARQNSNATLTANGIVPALTHRQMRRVRKNAIKHNEEFVYLPVNTRTVDAHTRTGHSLLARTPEGLGIYYRFLQD